MGWALVAILVVPFVAGILCWLVPGKPARVVTVGAAATVLGLAIALVPAVLRHPSVDASKYLRADALSVVFLVSTAFLYAVTSVFSVGYMHGAAGAEHGAVHDRRFWAAINLFAWSMAVAPIVNGLALLWVAIEITTVVSALLVALDYTDGATEAAWKYVLIASMGLGVALLATIIMYYAGSTVFGSAYDLSYGRLLSGAAHFPANAVRLSYLLAVLGFGTKMGLVPVHTWLPDAHSEAPTPVSALLSGSLLATSFYAILRYYQIATRAVGPTFPRDVLLGFGIASLLLAAVYLASQRDLKRLLAYSSIEHMGILAIGMSISAPVAVVGVLLHVMAHAAAKGSAFFGAGSVVRKYGTKDLSVLRGGIGMLPWTGPLLVLAVLGLSAMPPSGIFRSEFMIVSGGLSQGSDGAAVVLVVLAMVAFVGLAWYVTRTMISPVQPAATTSAGAVPAPLVKGETSATMVLAMVLALIALAILGVHPPGQLDNLLTKAASQLGPYS
ncbi:MAG: proton-conducting transporter transmembrane domain-containing protein [Acidimicrobiales bacterium]